ncbi:MAG: hypothetical protein AAF587_37225 [Bacteroidota bacterium]
MWQSFQHGIQTGIRHWRVAALVFLIQFLIAMVFGLQVGSLWDMTIGDSLSVDKLLGGYDHTVITDFLTVNSGAFSMLMTELKWLILFSIALGVFLDAGQMSAIVKDEYYWPSFFEGAKAYFIPFLKIWGVMTVITIFWTLILWLPLLINLFSALESFPSEVSLVWVVLLVLGVYLLGLLALSQIAIVARTHYISTNGADNGVRASLKEGFRWMRSRGFSSTGLYLMFVGFQIVMAILYGWIESSGGMISTMMIAGFFVIQQAYSYFRVIMEMMVMGGISGYYLAADGDSSSSSEGEENQEEPPTEE